MKKVLYALLLVGLVSCEKKTCYTCTITTANSGTANAASFNTVYTAQNCNSNDVKNINNTYVKKDTTVLGIHITGLTHTSCMPD